MTRAPLTWFDRIALHVAPTWQLRRIRTRLAVDLVARQYEAAGVGRRTQGWRKSATDADQATGPYTGPIREIARELVRNNPYAEAALATIVTHTVGWGIVPTTPNAASMRLWAQWADTTACDADGRHDFAGLQKLILRTVVESGEVLIRRRFRRPEDGLPIPMQLQVLEPDFLDTQKNSFVPDRTGANRIIHGVEFDAIGRRVAYWLFPEHPGSAFASVASERVRADNILHAFRLDRAGQVRGMSWFAPVLTTFKDFDELADATLMKQKIAACLAVITSDIDGTAPPLGVADTSTDPQIDSLEPGMILNVAAGRSVEVVQPPSVREYGDFAATILHAISTGLGVAYEDMTGSFEDLPFSAARMSHLRHWSRVDDWRWRLLVPQVCDPVWRWFTEVAGVMGTTVGPARWTAPPPPLVDPVNEGLAYTRNIRSGIMTLSEALRERGFDPVTVLNEMAADNKILDRFGLILDSDPRQMTQAGQLQGEAAAAAEPAAVPAPVRSLAEAIRGRR